MNHVSLNLTKGLREVSGWDDTSEMLVKFELSDELIKLPNMEGDLKLTTLSGPEEWRAPYYDVGYLLKKLPHFKSVNKMAYYLQVMAGSSDENPTYVAGYWHYQAVGPGIVRPICFMSHEAATPEDALAKLAFELWMGDHFWATKGNEQQA